MPKELDYSIVATNIRAELKAYLVKSGLKSLVLGISGGIDSTLCVALARPVCDELGVTLYGRSITIETNTAEERERAQEVGNLFCHDFNEIQLTTEYSVMNNALESCEGVIEDDRANKIRKGNVKARMRMIYLYNLAQTTNGMVLSTDNYTEFMVGFWTIAGDIGDYGMVQNLYKMEVYALSRWIAENENDMGYDLVKNAIMHGVDAVPTDGLGITSSDVEQLGAKDYAEVDNILQSHFKDNSVYVDHPVIKRHYASEFKRNNPFNLPRAVVLKDAE